MIEKKYAYSDFDTKYFKEHNLDIKNFDIDKDGEINNSEANTLVSVFDVKSIGYLLTKEKLKNDIDNLEQDEKTSKTLNICKAALTGTFVAGFPVTILTNLKNISFKASIGVMLLGLVGGVATGICLAKKKIKEDETYFENLKEAYNIQYAVA